MNQFRIADAPQPIRQTLQALFGPVEFVDLDALEQAEYPMVSNKGAARLAREVADYLRHSPAMPFLSPEILPHVADVIGRSRTVNEMAQARHAPSHAELGQQIHGMLSEIFGPNVHVIPLHDELQIRIDGPRDTAQAAPPTKNEERWATMQKLADSLFDELSTERDVMTSESRLIRAQVEESVRQLTVLANAIAEQDRRMAILSALFGGQDHGQGSRPDHGESTSGAPQGSQAGVGRSAVSKDPEPTTQSGAPSRVS